MIRTTSSPPRVRPTSPRRGEEVLKPQRRKLPLKVEDAEPSSSSSTLTRPLFSLLPSFKLGPPPPSSNLDRYSNNSPFPNLLQKRADQGNAARRDAIAGRGPALVWFRADLRTHDSETLAAATRKGHTSLVPLYIFDSREWSAPSSSPAAQKAGATRAKMILDSVAELRSKLRTLGSDLIVRMGRTEDVLAQLTKKVGATAVYLGHQLSYEEGRVLGGVRRAVEAAGAAVKVVGQPTSFHREDLPFALDQMPKALKDFEARVASLQVRPEAQTPGRLPGLPLASSLEHGAIPTLEQLGYSKRAEADPWTASVRGGEGEALRVLAAFLKDAKAGALEAATAGKALPAGVLHTRFNDLTRFLALGCVSARRVWHEIHRNLGQDVHVAAVLRKFLVHRDFHSFVFMRVAETACGATKSPQSAGGGLVPA